MTRSEQAAERISTYLLTGMHHATPEGKEAIAAIVRDAIVWWENRSDLGTVGVFAPEQP